MRHRLAAATLLCTAAAALAGDGEPEKPVAPAKPEAPAEPAKKERKVSREAEAAVTRYAGLLHFPSASHKSVQMDSHCELAMFGGEVNCRFSLKPGGEVALDIKLPEAATQQYPEEQLDFFKKQAETLVGSLMKPFLVPADAMAKEYDLEAKEVDARTTVSLARFAERAVWDRATLWFNADGLLEKQVGTLNVDPNDPMSQSMAGVEIETTFEYAKRGDRYTIETGRMVQPMGENVVKLKYFEIEGQAPLPREIEVTTPYFAEPILIVLHDFVVDGKPVKGTERKAAEAAKTPEKPAETAPAKPDAK